MASGSLLAQTITFKVKKIFFSGGGVGEGRALRKDDVVSSL